MRMVQKRSRRMKEGYRRCTANLSESFVEPSCNRPVDSVRMCAEGESLLKPLTRIRVGPVAHGGIDAKIGTKKTETKKQRPVTIDVSPVSPPSAMPAPLSIKAVTGEQPKSALMEIQMASQQYAIVERGKSPSSASTTPQNLTIEYNVAVASMIST